MNLNMNENIDVEKENLNRETRACAVGIMDTEMYDEVMMVPYDMRCGYGYGISSDQGDTPYWVQSYPITNEGMHPQIQNDQSIYRQHNLLPLLLLGLSTGYSPYYHTFYSPYYPPYYPPYSPSYYPSHFSPYYGDYYIP